MRYAAVGRQAIPWILFLVAIVVCSVQGPFLLSVATVTYQATPVMYCGSVSTEMTVLDRQLTRQAHRNQATGQIS